jgi:hypothetical protein
VGLNPLGIFAKAPSDKIEDCQIQSDFNTSLVEN